MHKYVFCAVLLITTVKLVQAETVIDSPMLINGDESIQHYATVGSGTPTDPYIIENYTINLSYEVASALRIFNVNKYVKFVNINILATPDVYHAVFILDSTNVQLEGITVEGGYKGIFVRDSENISITKSTVHSVLERGISSRRVKDFLVDSCTVYNTGERGIHVDPWWQNVVISNNEVYGTLLNSPGGEGIEAIGDEDSSEILFYRNYVHDNAEDGLEFVRVKGGRMISNVSINNLGQGIDLFASSDGNIIEENIVSGNLNRGVLLTDSSENIVRNNMIINNSPIGLEIEDRFDRSILNYVSGNILYGNEADIATDNSANVIRN